MPRGLRLTYSSYTDQSWLPANIKEVSDFISNNPVYENLEIDDWCQLGIYISETGELIGDIGINLLENNTVEIGFTVASEYQRKGYAYEAVSVLLDILHREKGINKFIGRADPSNIASVKLLHKLGFEESGLVRNSLMIRGEWKDDLIFSREMH